MATTQFDINDSSRQIASQPSVLLRIAFSRPRVILIGLIAGLLVGAGVALMLPSSYTAHATFIPPSSNTASSAMLMSQLSALAGAGGTSAAAKDPGAICVGILDSRTVADAMIDQFHLQSVYKQTKRSQAEKAFASHVRVMENKDGMIAVSAEDTDAKRAADLTNALLMELMRQNDRLAITEAAQRRVYFERELAQEKNALADAEVALTETEQKTGLVHPSAQTLIQIQSVAQTQAEIANQQIELAALEQSETPENPEIIRLRSQLSTLRAVLNQQEGNDGGEGDPVIAPMARTPELEQMYVRKQRDLKFHESLFEFLLKEYETAKLDESKSAPLIQIVDKAVVPDTKSGPPRTLITFGLGLLGLLLACGLVVVRELARTTLADDPTYDPVFGRRILHIIAGTRA